MEKIMKLEEVKGQSQNSDNIKHPLVSVILNCYNGEKYLKEAIDSVYSQTYKNWEIIFWDNVSTDSSAEIARAYDSKLKYFCAKEHVPLGHARKLALEHAKGDYISFIDADDIWLPEKLEIQIKKMINEGFDLCNASLVQLYEDTGKVKHFIKKNKSGWVFKQQLKQFDVNIQTLLISRKCLDETGLTFDTRIIGSEEYCLTMQLMYSYKMCIIKDFLAIYRVRSHSLTEEVIKFWAVDREITLNEILKKHPESQVKFKREYKIAFARARFYRARYFVKKNERLLALKELRGIILVDYRYLILYILVLLSPRLFNVFFYKFNRRRRNV